jgi:hypothetical protein
MGSGGHRSGFAKGLATGLAVAGLAVLILLLRTGPAGVEGAPAPRREARERGAGGAPEAAGGPAAPAAREPEASATADPGGEEPAPAGPEGAGAELPAAPDPGAAYRERERALLDGLRNRCVVRIVDADTGKPLPRTRFSLFIGTSGSGGNSTGLFADDEGSAVADPRGLAEWGRRGLPPDMGPIGSADDPLRAIFRVRVPGYRAAAVDAVGEKVEVKLEPVRSPAMFGTVRGLLTGPDGAPWTRPVELSLQDPEVLDSLAYWVVPDADGRYELTGVPSGDWGVKATDCWGQRVRVALAPGGVAEADVPVAEGDRGNFPEKRRPVAVQVTGLHLPYGGALVLEGDWGAPLRAAVQGEVATFPGVPLGAIKMTLRRPDSSEGVPGAAVVAEGPGRLELKFP